MDKQRYFDGILQYFSKANMPLCKTIQYFLMVYRDISRYFDDIYGYSQSTGRQIIFINISMFLIM